MFYFDGKLHNMSFTKGLCFLSIRCWQEHAVVEVDGSEFG